MMHDMVTGMTGKDEMHEKMEKLKEMKGMEFDMEFLSLMQMHHQQAIDMSQLALKNAQSPELKKMAQEMIDQQEKEVKEFQTMEKEME